MTVNINAYKEMLNQPWGKIMYRLIFAQLSHVKNKQVLDFGAGFGTTSQYLSQNNTVTAVEPNGELSLIKHNLTGKVLHQVIFNNNIEDALHLLEGKDSYNSSSFGHGETYSIDELTSKTNLTLENYQGLRTFYALQPNAFKTEEGWLEHLTEIELAVANQKPYKNIAFLQHLTLRKN